MFFTVTLCFFDLVQGPNGPQGAIGYPGPRGIKVSLHNYLIILKVTFPFG